MATVTLFRSWTHLQREWFLTNKRIDSDIASIDLEMVKMKLSEPKGASVGQETKLKMQR